MIKQTNGLGHSVSPKLNIYIYIAPENGRLDEDPFILCPDNFSNCRGVYVLWLSLHQPNFHYLTFRKGDSACAGFSHRLGGGHFPVLLASRSARYHRIQYGYPLFMDKVFRASSIPACEFWPEKFSFRKMTGQFAPKIYDLRIVWSCEERNLFWHVSV